MARNLLKTLINASEKAANIARVCRKDESLLRLLVEEKSGAEANPRFVHDFKTLADVLIQETLHYDLGEVFPELRDNIQGEESATFTNKLGDSVTVTIGANPEQTLNCLTYVLNGNRHAAQALVDEVHKDVVWGGDLETVPSMPEDIDYSKFGIWIDPIDATAEYIAGETVFSSFPGITSTGLDCCTILIGVYDRETGVPVMGVINQPFAKLQPDLTYVSEIYWGIALGDVAAHNIKDAPKKPTKVAVISASENPKVVELVKTLRYETACAAGAGHKALKVITGEADLYVLSKSTTFRWDTCAPHAILRALGGNMFDMRLTIKNNDPVPISYIDNGKKSNEGGLIVIKDIKVLEKVLPLLAD